VCQKFDFNGFLHFDVQVSSIDRLGKGFLYKHEEILPIDWRLVKSSDLFEIQQILKQKKFYFYKDVEGKLYKTRIKRNATK
jgi:hypothetical protein